MVERSEIESALAEGLSLIRQRALRQKIVDAFMLAIQEGGWTSMGDLSEMPFSLLTDTRGITFFEHTLAVTKGAYGLAQGQLESYRSMPYAIDLDRLAAGGLLHDVGKLVEIERKLDGSWAKSKKGTYVRHSVASAILCAKVGLPEDIVNTVACHAREGYGAPKALETMLIHQADLATFGPLVMLSKGQLIS